LVAKAPEFPQKRAPFMPNLVAAPSVPPGPGKISNITNREELRDQHAVC
jgi:hypothetical protein